MTKRELLGMRHKSHYRQFIEC